MKTNTLLAALSLALGAAIARLEAVRGGAAIFQTSNHRKHTTMKSTRRRIFYTVAGKQK